MKYISTVILFAVLALMANAQASSDTQQAAAVLFSRYGSVALTPTSFLASAQAHDEHFIGGQVVMQWPYQTFLSGLLMLGMDQLPTTPEEVTPVAMQRLIVHLRVLAEFYPSFLVGAKDFVGPREGLGMAASNQCSVGISDSYVQTQMEGLFKRRATKQDVNGRAVWVWRMPPYEGFANLTTMFYAAQVNNYLVICSTLPLPPDKLSDVVANTKDFVAVATALSAHATKPTVIDWDEISKHSYWVHHSTHKEGQFTSLPLNTEAAVLYADIADNHTNLTYRLHGASTVAPQTFQKGVELRTQSPGVWQTTVPLTKEAPFRGMDSLAAMFEALGFGVSM